MARSIWNGAISFGMVSIPVGLGTATVERDLSFNQIHEVCGSRIRLQKYCPVCERVVENSELQKGYEYSKGNYAIITEDDLNSLPVPSKHAINVVAFVKSEQIDPIYYDKSYFLEPSDMGRKPYALLKKALEDKGVNALAKIAIRNKESLCVLRPIENGILLETLFYPDEVREQVDTKISEVNVDDKELDMAKNLVDLMAEDFDPGKYKDEYRDALMERIETKISGGELVQAPEVPKESQVIDLVDALKESLEAAKKDKAKSS